MKIEPLGTEPVFLVPVDFQPASLAALRSALELARPRGARVVIFHAYQLPPWVYAGMPPEVRKRLCEQVQDDALQPLNQLAERWGVRSILREGNDVANLVLEVATELGAERIFIGTHGRRGLDRLLVGSVAEQIVRRSPVPVLTVRSEAPEHAAGETRRRVVLCAVDLGPATRDVVDLARTFADELGAELELVHAVAALFYVYPTFDPILARDLDVEVRRAAKQSLDRVLQESGAARHHIVTGDAGKSILELVEHARPEALVIGTHGRRGASRLFLGSVAEWLLRRSPVPILTARIPEHADADAGGDRSSQTTTKRNESAA
jgi:nucleotide-binding universal stress UspA family protein